MRKKICKKCGAEKAMGQFPILTSGYGDGHIGICKSCKSLYRKDYYRKNHKIALENAQSWNKAHPERSRERVKRWKKKHREYINLQNRLYQLKNPGKRSAITRKYRAWIKATDDKTITLRALEELILKQQWKCNFCKKDISIIRQKDHIIPLSKGGKHTISNIQWLCPPCNLKKGDSL